MQTKEQVITCEEVSAETPEGAAENVEKSNLNSLCEDK